MKSVIKTEKDYKKALRRIEKVFDAEPGTKQGDELDILSNLAQKCEKEHSLVTSQKK